MKRKVIPLAQLIYPSMPYVCTLIDLLKFLIDSFRAAEVLGKGYGPSVQRDTAWTQGRNSVRWDQHQQHGGD